MLRPALSISFHMDNSLLYLLIDSSDPHEPKGNWQLCEDWSRVRGHTMKCHKVMSHKLGKNVKFSFLSWYSSFGDILNISHEVECQVHFQMKQLFLAFEGETFHRKWQASHKRLVRCTSLDDALWSLGVASHQYVMGWGEHSEIAWIGGRCVMPLLSRQNLKNLAAKSTTLEMHIGVGLDFLIMRGSIGLCWLPLICYI